MEGGLLNVRVITQNAEPIVNIRQYSILNAKANVSYELNLEKVNSIGKRLVEIKVITDELEDTVEILKEFNNTNKNNSYPHTRL